MLVALGMLLLPALVRAEPTLDQGAASADPPVGIRAALAGQHPSVRPRTLVRDPTTVANARLRPCLNLCGPEANPLFPRSPGHLIASVAIGAPLLARRSPRLPTGDGLVGAVIGAAPPRDRGPPAS
jgi:hypothetical protein